jgi:hypothetical protein
VAALCLLRGVRRFKVTWRRGGYVEHGSGSRLGDDLIGLAPYMVPTATFAVALLTPLVAPPLRPWFFGLAGVTFGYHLVSTVREIRASFTRQGFRPPGGRREVRTDIGQRGLVYSSAFILAGFLLFHGITAALLADGYAGVPIWGRAFWQGTLQLQFRQSHAAPDAHDSRADAIPTVDDARWRVEVRRHRCRFRHALG